MKTILLTATACALSIVLIPSNTSRAQGPLNVQNGYGFGLGIGYGSAYGIPQQRCHPGLCGVAPFGGVVISPPREDLPYFAKFPPVHYSGIVPRPYGVSPYAAPPGILPIEMTMPAPVAPAVIKNPFYVPDPVEAVPARTDAEQQSEPADSKERRVRVRNASTIGDVQRVVNPFFHSDLVMSGY